MALGPTGTGQPFVSPDDIRQRRWENVIDADRVTLIGQDGFIIDNDHPLPTTATIATCGLIVNVDAVKIEDKDDPSKRVKIDSDQSMRVKLQEVVPTDTTTVNPSSNFQWTGENLTQIDKIIDGITYRKALTYDGNNNLISVGEWVQI